MDLIWVILAVVFGTLFLVERQWRINAQRQLAAMGEKREAMRACLEHLAEGVVLLDREDRVLFANHAAVLLVGAKAAPESGDYPYWASFSGVQNLTELIARSGHGESIRRNVELAGDESRVVKITLAPAGEHRRLLVMQDLQGDEAVNRKRRDFVANASHELKTPIAALVGLLDLMDVVSEEKRTELLERAQANAASLSNMAEDLLGLARIEDPDWRPSPKVLSVDDLVARMTDEFRDRAESKSLDLEIEHNLSGEHVLADPVCLDTVLRNLLSNAIHYTDSGRVVLASIQPDESASGDCGAVFEVRDSGPGVPADLLPRIFERFFRVDAAHSRAKGGTGLGLSIVQNMMRRLGGRISVTSKDGEGTVFRVELPTNPGRPLPGQDASLGA